MRIKLVFYIPEGLKDANDVKEINRFLDKIVSLYNVEVIKQVINSSEEERLKSHFLWSLSVVKRIGIKQTIRTKSLYPQLVIFDEDVPLTFYPQSYGKECISIQEFLEGLLKDRIMCLHDEEKIKESIMKVRK